MKEQGERGLKMLMGAVIVATVVLLEVYCRVFSQGLADLLEVWR